MCGILEDFLEEAALAVAWERASQVAPGDEHCRQEGGGAWAAVRGLMVRPLSCPGESRVEGGWKEVLEGQPDQRGSVAISWGSPGG